MYHVIRGQAVIKLYIFFNMLDVGDRLLASFGQVCPLIRLRRSRRLHETLQLAASLNWIFFPWSLGYLGCLVLDGDRAEGSKKGSLG